MEPNPLNPDEPTQPPPRMRGTQKRADFIEFEFAKETVDSRPQQAIPKEPTKLTSSETPNFTEAPPATSPVAPSTETPSQSPKTTSNPSQPRTAMSNPPIRPSTITDFKRNIDQQKKEQRSFSNVLVTITYVVLIGLILVTGLAGYGARVFYLRLNQQANTLNELDRKYEAAVIDLNEDLKRSRSEIDKVNGQLARQQEQISVLRSSLDKALIDARSDRASNAREIASLLKQISDLEARISMESKIGRP